MVDLEAERSRLQLELKHVHGEKDSKETKRMKDLDKETKDRLKQRIVELENELGEYVVRSLRWCIVIFVGGKLILAAFWPTLTIEIEVE